MLKLPNLVVFATHSVLSIIVRLVRVRGDKVRRAHPADKRGRAAAFVLSREPLAMWWPLLPSARVPAGMVEGSQAEEELRRVKFASWTQYGP